MARRPKYRPGPLVRSMNEVDRMIERRDWFWMFGRPINAGFVTSMQFHALRVALRTKSVRRAVPTTKE